MEKLFLVLLLNGSPDTEPKIYRFEAADCITAMNRVNSDPNNITVFQDELGDVKKYVAMCEYTDKFRIIVPTFRNEGN